ncbi:MAG: type II toxin-antitoxin system VapC family toxin [Pyrinomonadaceae bacterium]
MKLLLDAHAFLWFIAGDERLTNKARSIIEDAEKYSFVSAATLWEIALKTSLGRLSLTVPFGDLISHQMRLNGFQLLSINPSHLELLLSLQFHHRDPFDRIIVAQAAVEAMSIVSADSSLDAYEVKRLW